MKIGLVMDESSKYDGYNWHDAYAQEFTLLGDEVIFLNFKKIDWLEQIKSSKPDLIMWRAWHRPDDRDDAKIKIQLIENLLKIPIFPNWKMYASYDNKIMQYTLLKELNITMPKTWIFREKGEALDFAETAEFPIVSKCSEGACGDNVNLIKDKQSLIDHIKSAFEDKGIDTYFPWIKQKGYVYLQEYIPSNKDLRIITIGHKVELAFWRENENSWKHNIAGGGKINPENIPKEAKEICLKISKLLNFHWCAFDLIEANNKIYLLEFSSIFGFSKCGFYEKFFGSPNAFILKKQAKYLHDLFRSKA
jgi:glutathione synthase/RimK-type ligase-like ATP-grasp enzyme